MTDAGNRVIYSPDYFAPYNVVTARDQLERIPGLQEIFDGGDDDQRGFRQFRRPSADQRQTFVRQVERHRLRDGPHPGSAKSYVLEVIRGTVTGLDVRSQGRVVNVVL